MTQPTGRTSEIEMIARRVVQSQANVCAVEMKHIKETLSEMGEQIGNLTLKLTDLTLQMTKQFAEMKSEIALSSQRSNQRWRIWPALKDILIVILSVASFAVALYALKK